MSPRNMKLSLSTIFNTSPHTEERSSRSRIRRSNNTPSSSVSPVPISVAYSSTQPYPFLARPHTPITSPGGDSLSTTSSPMSSSSSPSPARSRLRHIRRQPSTADLALHAERTGLLSGAENLGLGLLEPRPRAVSSGSSGSLSTMSSDGSGSPREFCSWEEFFLHENEGFGREVVLDGIFEVLERGR
ncbi:uncharacterized protein AB675_9526 [Cyphellophora attinorum]|uniref:Uncharacterized protein n=1 Tax=Cyphellophora attinorum TaxID=1664694 RepID=A0A0N1HX65_9EURO|nr:uncharacterized protein AB675_9526 [Phialophora attinorum]KPI42460.1 hypothetical protein AB675_9526 [Phialophora attinorum]